MRSFSDEFNAGTIEILRTKPLTDWQLILGKYFGALILAVLAIAPTLIYVFSLYQLGNPIGNINIGTTIGSFLGLLFLASAYTSIGIFASALSNNQIVSFIIAVFSSFFLFYGFEAMATYTLFGNSDYLIQKIGMNSHYSSIGKGVLDTQDLLYFISVTVFFLFLTKLRIQHEK